jgi:hypothetical protein
MDTRDLIPGKSYPTQLTDAIKGSRVIVLVFSSNSDASEAVQNEVGLARNCKIPIIPVRVENVVPHALALFITTSQWLDAFPPPVETHLHKVAGAVKTHIEAKQIDQHVVPSSAGSILQPSATSGVIADQEWHDIDYGDLTDWVKVRAKVLDSGKVVVGKTFLYRLNHFTGRYQRRLRELA